MLQQISAERGGFEPPVRLRRTTVFETGPFDHSGTSPITYFLFASLTINAYSTIYGFSRDSVFIKKRKTRPRILLRKITWLDRPALSRIPTESRDSTTPAPLLLIIFYSLL